MNAKDKTCCFTGHRKILKYKISQIADSTRASVINLIEKGVCCFCIGAALGYELNGTTSYEITPFEEEPILIGTFAVKLSTKASYIVATAAEEFTNNPSIVTLHKTDLTTGEVVPGAEIVIFNEDGTVYAENTTDDNGDIELYAIPAGKYTFVETVAPDGYTINTNTFEFEVSYDENGKTVITGDTEITDKPTEVTLTKTDKVSGLAVPNAVYTFYDVDNNEVGTLTTDENGTGTITKLPVGTYTYKETTAPEGYVIDPTVYEITIEEDGTITGNTELVDEPTQVILTKENEDGETLAGAEFVIYTEEGEEYGTFTTDEDGVITLNYIPVGSYVYSETTAPAGYILDPETYTFAVNADGSIEGTTTMLNVKTSVTIQKVDAETDEGLKGATIEIYDKDGNVVNQDNKVTDEEGYLVVEGLPVGSYTFKEIEAPEGYELNDETYEFTINEDGSVDGSFIIKDNVIVIEKEPEKEEKPEVEKDNPEKTVADKVKTGTAIGLVATVALGTGLALIRLRKKIDE